MNYDIEKSLQMAGHQSFLGGLGKYIGAYFVLFIILTLLFWWITNNIVSTRKNTIIHLCISLNWIAFFYALLYIFPLYSLKRDGMLDYLPRPIALKVASFIVLLLCIGSLIYLVFYRNKNLYVSKRYKIGIIGGMIGGLILNKIFCGSIFLFFPTILVCLVLIVWGVIKF